MREKFLIYFSHTLTNKRYIINKANKKKEWQVTGESIKDAENEVEEKTNHSVETFLCKCTIPT